MIRHPGLHAGQISQWRKYRWKATERRKWRRRLRLLGHGFGLWDVLDACEREGSLDSSIRKPAANDFARLRTLCPALEMVGFNGQTSGKFATQFAAAGYRTLVLPSTSPAHASLSFDEKLASWRLLVI